VAVREAALQHGPDALTELARLMTEGQSEQVRIAACREILDRACGKSRQAIEVTGHDAGPIAVKKIDDRERMRRLACFLLEDRAAAHESDAEEQGIGLRGSSAVLSDNP